MFRRLSAQVRDRSHTTRLQFRPRPTSPDSRHHAIHAHSAPSGTRPVSTYLQRAMTSLRAMATIITRRIRPFALPHQSLNHLLSALSGLRRSQRQASPAREFPPVLELAAEHLVHKQCRIVRADPFQLRQQRDPGRSALIAVAIAGHCASNQPALADHLVPHGINEVDLIRKHDNNVHPSLRLTAHVCAFPLIFMDLRRYRLANDRQRRTGTAPV